MLRWRERSEQRKARSVLLATLGVLLLSVGLFLLWFTYQAASMSDEDFVQSLHVHPTEVEETLARVSETRASHENQQYMFGGFLILFGAAALYWGARPRYHEIN